MRRYLITSAIALCLLTACSGSQKTDGKQPAVSEKEAQMLKMAAATEEAGDYKRAADFYRRAAGASSGNVIAHLKLAEMLRKQNEPGQALEALAKAKKMEPDSPAILKEEGNNFITLGSAEDALKSFDEALKYAPHDPKLYNGKGVALDMLGDNKAAQQSYRTGIKLDPRNASATENNLALSLIISGDYHEAIRLLERISVTPAASATTRQNLAMAYALSGNETKAMEIGGKDITAEQLKQNMAFFEQYRHVKVVNAETNEAVPAAPVEINSLEEPVKPVPLAAAKPEKSDDLLTVAPTAAQLAPAAVPVKPKQTAIAPTPKVDKTKMVRKSAMLPPPPPPQRKQFRPPVQSSNDKALKRDKRADYESSPIRTSSSKPENIRPDKLILQPAPGKRKPRQLETKNDVPVGFVKREVENTESLDYTPVTVRRSAPTPGRNAGHEAANESVGEASPAAGSAVVGKPGKSRPSDIKTEKQEKKVAKKAAKKKEKRIPPERRFPKQQDEESGF